jgi:transcriptional regulator with XRE-family HTH domain
MPTKLSDKIKSLPPARQKKIEERTEELMAEEMSLRELRKARHLAQEQLAGALGIGQDGISRLEKRSDLLLSTLRSYIEAMGGNLSLIAEFPGHPPVSLTGLADMETAKPAKAVSKRAASALRRPRAAHVGAH